MLHSSPPLPQDKHILYKTIPVKYRVTVYLLLIYLFPLAELLHCNTIFHCSDIKH